ncbi:hypothetical protein QUG92_11155 [Curtobacterium sp. RHCKG23]|uniref:Uncharacterized protein n=1 Tax=Curtobacterium citri TaxID=3055139 RepID=A0ABT7T7X0_9MICO|nr:hypothetical protein [Curtobacterium citri]MDM7885661.1 hypothetical protein [Curtobacterium citri]
MQPLTLDPTVDSPADTALATRPLLDSAPASEDDELWYHDHETKAQWERLDNLRQAEAIIRSRTARNPWAGIGRFSHRNADGEFEQLHLFEVLGWADRVYVCGDVSRVGFQWRWSSWPADTLHQGRTPGAVGPDWYRADVYEQQVVTVHDAVTQFRPALHAIEGVNDQAPGYVWLPREHDFAANQHLRTPLDDS